MAIRDWAGKPTQAATGRTLADDRQDLTSEGPEGRLWAVAGRPKLTNVDHRRPTVPEEATGQRSAGSFGQVRDGRVDLYAGFLGG
jgi:hypothetical protein